MFTPFDVTALQPYPKTLQGLGFDYTYDKNLHDLLGSGNLDNIRAWINPSGQNILDYIQHSAHCKFSKQMSFLLL